MSPSCTNLLTQQGETHLSIILLLLQVTFCHNLPWCKTIGLWAGNLQLQVCGYWQGRGEDNLQQISQMSCLEHRVQTSHLTFPNSLTSRPVEWPPCPDRNQGAGWHLRGAVRQGNRGLCAVWQFTSMSTPSSLPKTSPSPQHAPSAAYPSALFLWQDVPGISPSHASLTAGRRTEILGTRKVIIPIILFLFFV